MFIDFINLVFKHPLFKKNYTYGHQNTQFSIYKNEKKMHADLQIGDNNTNSVITVWKYAIPAGKGEIISPKECFVIHVKLKDKEVRNKKIEVYCLRDMKTQWINDMQDLKNCYWLGLLVSKIPWMYLTNL